MVKFSAFIGVRANHAVGVVNCAYLALGLQSSGSDHIKCEQVGGAWNTAYSTA